MPMSKSGNSPAGPPPDSRAGEFVPDELPERVAELAGQISEAETESRRRRLALGLPRLALGLPRLALGLPRLAGRGGRSAWTGLQSGGRWLASQVLAMAPRLPV